MGNEKAPAFQLYVRDVLTDSALQRARAATRGIWFNAVCLMWLEDERGKLVVTPDEFPRVLNCTAEERDAFIADCNTLAFADIAERDGAIVMVNRRMHREHKSSRGNALRQQRYRQRRKNADDTPVESEAAGCGGDADVTPPSSYSPSSAPSSSSAKSLVKGFLETPGNHGKAGSPPDFDKVSHNAQLIMEKLYGRSWPHDSEARRFMPFIFKVTGMIREGRLVLDRVLAAASEVKLDHNEGKVNHRSAVFTTIVRSMSATAKAEAEGHNAFGQAVAATM